VKTAISVPDDVFLRATQAARDLGMSRSEFFSRAAASYLDWIESRSLRLEIEKALEAIGDSDDSADAAVRASKAYLQSLDDEW
jgi:metal-responsive CopG/Arc/MetJ family transcriptional regulator